MIHLFQRIIVQPKFNAKFIPLSRMSNSTPQKVSSTESTAPHTENYRLPQKRHFPTNFEKSLLVWAGIYKKKEDIPESISTGQFEKARGKARIKLANYSILITLLCCVGVAISGRRAAHKGESVSRKNLDWHKQLEDQQNEKKE